MNETLLNMPIMPRLGEFSEGLERTVKFNEKDVSKNKFNLDTTIDSQENIGKPSNY